jgi:hypothetical protein
VDRGAQWGSEPLPLIFAFMLDRLNIHSAIALRRAISRLPAHRISNVAIA